MTVHILPSLPPADPIGAKKNAAARAAFPRTIDQRLGFSAGYIERDMEVMPFVDSLRGEILHLKNEYASLWDEKDQEIARLTQLLRDKSIEEVG